MKVRRKKRRGRASLATPVLDVMFLLIIALLTVSHLRPRAHTSAPGDTTAAELGYALPEDVELSLGELEERRERVWRTLAALLREAVPELELDGGPPRPMLLETGLARALEEARELPGVTDRLRTEIEALRERLEALGFDTPGPIVAELTDRIAGLADDRERLLERVLVLLEDPRFAEADLAGVLEALHGDVNRTTADLEEVLRALAELRSERDRLEGDVVVLERKAEELAALEHDLAGHGEKIDQLEGEIREKTMRLATLQADAARAQGEKYFFQSGAPIVDVHKRFNEEYGLLLAEGRAFSLEPEYCTIQRSGGVINVTPKRSERGFTARAILADGSPLRKTTDLRSFREKGRVVLFVNSDSFATFRVVRDHLAGEGVPYGWEPWDGKTLRFADSGRRPATNK